MNISNNIQGVPRGLRLHIGLFGRRNSGKSTLMNALTGQTVSIVSAHPGTTTDPVEKAFELAPLGAVVFIDTAGLDDAGELGVLRMNRTRAVLERTDLALIVVDDGRLGMLEQKLIAALRAQCTPFVVVFNKADLNEPPRTLLQELADDDIESVIVGAAQGRGIDTLKEAIVRHAPENGLEEARLIGDLVGPGDFVVLVTPIDLGAPKGRLILPQVQTLRDILDSGAVSVMLRENELAAMLPRLAAPPRLIVCDSQAVLQAAVTAPREIPLTTFSILMARFKGDISGFAEGAGAIPRLKPGDRVLVAEACAHHAQADDIARVKIPRWLRQFAGGDLEIEVKSGQDYPENLTPYALIVQCGGCTVTRRQMLARQYRAARQGVPMTNYGMAISVAQGVLDRSLQCFPAALDAYRHAREGTGA